MTELYKNDLEDEVVNVTEQRIWLRKRDILVQYQKQSGVNMEVSDISYYFRGEIVNTVGNFLQVLDERTGTIKEIVRNTLTEEFNPALKALKIGDEVEIIALPLDSISNGHSSVKGIFQGTGLKTDRSWELTFPVINEIINIGQTSNTNSSELIAEPADNTTHKHCEDAAQ